MSTPTAQAAVIETASHGEDDAAIARIEVLLRIPPASVMASRLPPTDPAALAAWTAGREALADAACGALEDYVTAGGSL